MDDVFEIVKRYENIKKEVEKFGKDVTIVVVTKYVKDTSLLTKLSDFGIQHLGENYAQNLEKRILEFSSLNFDYKKFLWHFIGHLQSNKVKKVVPIVEYIQSVDSFKLLEKINSESEKIGKVIKCLIEIKVSDEETKFGIKEEEVFNLIDNFINSKFENTKLCGLMTMAPYFDNNEFARPYFAKVRKLFEKIKLSYREVLVDFNILSMGMSNDYLVALEEGSNMIRIGSKIFGV
jgi:pyridoxal phosphate enzyme (YggS family)